MSTQSGHDVEVAVIGAGVVGCAVALALARRGAEVALFEAEPEPGLGASGANSGILHTGFDAPPGQLETELILRAASLRPAIVRALSIPLLACGAVMRPLDRAQRATVNALAARARTNGVTVHQRPDGALEVPGESVTDPVAFTLALAGAAVLHGAQLRTRSRVIALERTGGGMRVELEQGEAVSSEVVVNCAGLRADELARMAGDDSFDIYPRKGEFIVFEPSAGHRLDHVLLPVPSERTKGVLVFPTLDGKVVAGPTAVDLEDKDDWSVRAGSRAEILSSACPLYPQLSDAEPIAAYAGLRPAGRGVNYVIATSSACERLVNVAAIRSTGLTASLGIAERVLELVAAAGVALDPERELVAAPPPASGGPWWRRAADRRAPV